ncbi:hypothetical protein GG344DRAFT_84219 [Lentinula edodes]|nr:hypothetical protein GG344DRAFT_84219 [Lentinula edodes]
MHVGGVTHVREGLGVTRVEEGLVEVGEWWYCLREVPSQGMTAHCGDPADDEDLVYSRFVETPTTVMTAGKRSSIICKPCHDAKVRCPTTSKQREGGSGERITVMESQMAQGLTDLRALREAHSKFQQYLRQLLRRQENDHARLIAMETRMAMMGVGVGPVAAGPSRRVTEQPRALKQWRIMEESEEEEEEGEKKEKEVERDGEGEEEEMASMEAHSEKGKERME